MKDADCDAGQLCLCGAPVGTCVAATCKTDADCGAHGGSDALCLSYPSIPSCGNEVAFACQTPADECATNADCAGSGLICSVVTDHRACIPISCGFE